MLLAHWLYSFFYTAQILPTDPGEQVVLYLELQTSVKEIQPGMTLDVHGCLKLWLQELVILKSIKGQAMIGFHGEMAERDLNVDKANKKVRHKHKEDSCGPGWKVWTKAQIPCPEETQRYNLHDSNANLGPWENKHETLQVQEVSSKPHDQVKQPMLIWHKQLSHLVKVQDLVMVKGFDGLEELICDGQHWQMLNVWIKFNRVCDNMMCIMAFYPPPDAYTSQQIANDNTYAVIPICIMCDCVVASVMSNEGNLLPEERH